MSRTSINRQCPHCKLRHAGPFASCGSREDDDDILSADDTESKREAGK